MTYTVTYRDKSGAKREEVLEAAGRAECFAQCKARGIVPMSVKDGARKVSPKDGGSPCGRNKLRSSRSAVLWRAAILAAIALATAIGAWWWLGGRDDAPPPVEKPKAVKVVKDVKPPHVPKVVPSTPAATNAFVAKPEVPVAAPPAKKPQSNAHLLVKDPNARVIPHRPVSPRRFKYASEEFIASLLEMEPGAPVIGEFKLSKRFLEDFKKSLEEKIEILDSDSKDVRELKEAVAATKEDLRKRMEAGEDVCQILKDSRKQLQELAAYKMDLMAELRNIRKSGEWTAEEYVKFVSAANTMLESRGATPIKLPRVIVRQLRKQQEKGDTK